MRSFSNKSYSENKKNILCSLTIFEYCIVYEIMRKNNITGQTADANMAHAHCVVNTKG
jgi:hypothetical protein